MIANNKPQKVEIVNVSDFVNSESTPSASVNPFEPELPDTNKYNFCVLSGCIRYRTGNVLIPFTYHDWYLNTDSFPQLDYLSHLQTIATEYSTDEGAVTITYRKTRSNGFTEIKNTTTYINVNNE